MGAALSRNARTLRPPPGEYHYQHHRYYTVNYAEMEMLDKLFGTHHEQRWSSGKAVPKSVTEAAKVKADKAALAKLK